MSNTVIKGARCVIRDHFLQKGLSERLFSVLLIKLKISKCKIFVDFFALLYYEWIRHVIK